MTELIAADIGGTNARFVRATITADGRILLGKSHTYHTADHPDIASAWAAFAADEGRALPRAASLAVAAPIDGDEVRFTNSPWRFKQSALAGELGLDSVMVLNDFGAVAHAVALLDPADFIHIAGPVAPPVRRVTTISGMGTGLGVAQLLHENGASFVIETEGGHVEFAPLDPIEQDIARNLHARFGRVSTERLVCGPGLANIYEAFEGAAWSGDYATLWQAAIDGGDRTAAEALDRLVLVYGSVLGDLALAHGAHEVVIVGGLSRRIIERLKAPAFYQRFCAKGRYASRMAAMPIRLATHPEPGLLGAAAAFMRRG